MRTDILRKIIELKECTDIKEVAELLSTKAWIAIDATIGETTIVILGRIN